MSDQTNQAIFLNHYGLTFTHLFFNTVILCNGCENMINPYLEVRMKTLKGNMSPGQVTWQPLLQDELNAKDYKKLYKEELGNPVEKYCIPCPKTNLQIKCYLFTKRSDIGRHQDKHIMLEYTKQLQDITSKSKLR